MANWRADQPAGNRRNVMIVMREDSLPLDGSRIASHVPASYRSAPDAD